MRRAPGWPHFHALALVATGVLVAACTPSIPPLKAGSAEVRLPAPVGIGQSGNNGIGIAGRPRSPYVNNFPATQHILGHPNVKALALSRGEGHEILFVRTDQVAVIEQVRTSVVEELKKRTGKDYDDALVLGATHTHSGPGRFIPGEVVGAVIGDTFFPEWYERLVDAIADAAEQALKNLEPAEFGYVIAQAPAGHNDRRCEDLADRRNSQVPLLVVKKGGVVSDVLVSYAIHGTVIGIRDWTLSADVSGAIEERVGDVFDHPVHVQFMNAWAADMAPGDPSVAAPAQPLPPMTDGYEQLEKVGLYMADIVAAAAPTVTFTTEPEISSAVHRYRIDRERLGYGESEFPYEYGGVYCGASGASCTELKHLEDLDANCLPFPASDTAPLQTATSVGRVGGLHFATWSGEASTEVGELVMAGARENAGVTDFMFVGYANGYLGYAVREDDWWHGGYEASGGMWGPRQGEYMAARIVELFKAWKTGKKPSFEEPAAMPGATWEAYTPVSPEQALEIGKVVSQPRASYAPNELPSFTVNGQEPWAGAPLAVLQRETGGTFVDVLRPNGKPYVSDGYGFRVTLTPSPTYEEWVPSSPKPREFRWTFEAVMNRRGTPFRGDLFGKFRFKVTLAGADGAPMDVTSEPFAVVSDG
jgi:hypothetical protein